MAIVTPWLDLYPEEISKDLIVPNESLNDLFQSAIVQYSEQTAISFYHQTFTFKKVGAVVERFGSALASLGLEKQDRMAVMLPNCPHYIFSLFGAFHIGVIAVQVNPMYVEREIDYALKDSGAKAIIVYEPFYEAVKRVQNKSSVEHVIVVSFGQEKKELHNGDYYFDDFLALTSSIVRRADLNPEEDVAVLQYTGGTTGISKGVMLTHRNLRSNVEQVYEFMFKSINYPQNPKAISVLPMFHIFGLTCNVFQSFRVGTNQIILPRFDIEEVLETIKKEEPFQMAGVPTMYIALNSHPRMKEYGVDKISFYNSGGAAMPVEQLHHFEQQTGQYLYEGYGLSEASPVTHFNPPFYDRKAGSIGIPVPGTLARVVETNDAGLRDVSIGEVGELAIKGPQVMKGYWEKAEETEAALDDDGWLLTGDLARMDEEGYFYIVDRKKDMIVASGYNVYPREIEEVMYQHTAVQEVVVIGVPDPYRGETVKAYVVLKENTMVSEKDIIDFTRNYLAAYKVPRNVEFRDQLPKSAVGKLLRRRLRDEENQKYKDQTS